MWERLTEAGIEELAITGMKTEFCVDTTCRAAPGLGIPTVLIADAHTTMDNDSLTAAQIIQHHNITLAGSFVTLDHTEHYDF